MSGERGMGWTRVGGWIFESTTPKPRGGDIRNMADLQKKSKLDTEKGQEGKGNRR